MDLLLWGRGLEEPGVGGHRVHDTLLPPCPCPFFI